MSDTLKPQDLTAEERAIVDNCALFYRRAERDRGETAEWCYVEGFEEAEPIILARRKLYGEPQGAKAVCPNCKKAVVHRNEHVTAVGDEGLLDGFRFTCQPAPPPAPDDCPTFSDGTPIFPGRVKPAPVASELPEAVHEAANYLRQEARYEAEGGLKRTVHGKQIRARVLRDAADALEAWARSLPAASAAKARKLLCDLREVLPLDGNLLILDPEEWPLGIHAALAELDAAQAVPVEAIRYALSYLRSDTTKTNLLANIDTIDRWLAAVEGGR